jgi:hypothetical protein
LAHAGRVLDRGAAIGDPGFVPGRSLLRAVHREANRATTRRATDGTGYLQCDRVVITGIEKCAYAFLKGIAHGAQLEEAIRAARRTAPSFDSAATVDFLFAEGLILGVQ